MKKDGDKTDPPSPERPAPVRGKYFGRIRKIVILPDAPPAKPAATKRGK